MPDHSKEIKMNTEYIRDHEIRNQTYASMNPGTREYESCSFTGCNFSNADLSGISFVKCSFEHCDFSMAVLKNTVFRDIDFLDCKLLGLHFGDCNPFLLSFRCTNSVLDFSSFYKQKIRDTVFDNCSIREVDFTSADLKGVVFRNSGLERAVFDNTNLEGADFRTAVHFSINLENNRIAKAKFSAMNILGLLDHYNIEIE